MSDSDQGGFTIIWKTENVNFCRAWVDELFSPKFVAANLQNTEWILRLDIYRRNLNIDGLKVTLKRLDNAPKTVTVNFHIHLLIPGHSDQELGKMEGVSFKKDGQKSFTINNLGPKICELFWADILIIRCRIFMSSSTLLYSEKIIAQTSVSRERTCTSLIIEKFSSDNPEFHFICPPVSKYTHHLEYKGIKWQASSGFLSIVIGKKQVKNDDSLKIIGKIYILDVLGETKFSSEDIHCFRSNKDLWEFPITVNKSTLHRDCKLHLTNDNLMVVCDFTFLNEVISEIVDYTLCPHVFQSAVADDNKTQNSASNSATNYDFSKQCKASGTDNSVEISGALQDDFRKLYKQGSHCDVALCTGNMSIPCHKAILSARSPVFKAMFDCQIRESKSEEVEIPDLDGDILHRFLLYIYSETLEQLDWIVAKKLYYAANKYEMKSLMRECLTFLKSHLITSNVCEALEFAEMHQDNDLKTECQDLVFKHAKEIFVSTGWKEFSMKLPALATETLQKYFLLIK